MAREDVEMSSEERDVLVRIAAQLPELMDLALRLGAEVVVERLAAAEACAFAHLAADGELIPRDG